MEHLKTPLKNYFTHLDSFRAFAVMFVLFHHYWSQEQTQNMPLGILGVDAFFTLSGFLITGILLKYKETLTFGKAITTFYTRRFLRIFPLYYLLLVLVKIFFSAQLSQSAFHWASIFGLNFFQIKGHPVPEAFGQLWSLGVEEQFYLVWPFFMLLVPRNFIKGFVIFSIIGSIAFSILYGQYSKDLYIEYRHTLSCVQSLGIGALLAVLGMQKGSALEWIKKYDLPLLLLSLIGLVGAFLLYKLNSTNPVLVETPYIIPIRTAGSLLGFFTIVRLVYMKREDGFKKFMASPILQFIGRISYGIYVYHLLVKSLLDPVVLNILPAYHRYLFTFPLYTIVTIAVSYLSFKYFEKPINDIKDTGYLNLPLGRLRLAFLKSK